MGDELKNDLLDGVAAFAAFTGMPRRRVIYMLQKRQLPGGKTGRRWIGSKSVVREWLERTARGVPTRQVDPVNRIGG